MGIIVPFRHVRASRRAGQHTVRVHHHKRFVGEVVQAPFSGRLDQGGPVVDGDRLPALHCPSVLSGNPNGPPDVGGSAEAGEKGLNRLHDGYGTLRTGPSQGEKYSTKAYRSDMQQERVPANPPRLDEPHERLRWAREHAGYEGPTAAARKFHWNENTYRSNENGQRPFGKKAAAKYATAFKVPVAWLLYGEGSMTPPIDPELKTLWDDLTDSQRRHLLRYARMLIEEAA